MRSRLKAKNDQTFSSWLIWIVVGIVVAGGVYQAIRIRTSILHTLHKQTLTPITQNHDASATDKASAANAVDTDNTNSASDTDSAAQHVASHPNVLHVLSPGSLSMATALFHKARAELAAGNPINARQLLNRALHRVAGLGEKQATDIRSLLNQINRQTVISSALVPGDPLCRLITVRRGQTPDYLAHIYCITPAMLRRLNPQLDPRTLQAGRGIKVLLGPVDATLVLHANRIDLSIRSNYIISVPMRTDDLFPPAPGRYHLKSVYFQTADSPAAMDLDRIEVVPPVGSGRRGFSIRCISTQTGCVKVSPAAMRLLSEALSKSYSRVEVEP